MNVDSEELQQLEFNIHFFLFFYSLVLTLFVSPPVSSYNSR
jgi:hypothetical protein